MAAITIRQLSEEDKQRLRERAAANGRSMEAEARAILLAEIADETPKPVRLDINWADAFIRFGELLGEDELELPPQSPARMVDFSGFPDA